MLLMVMNDGVCVYVCECISAVNIKCAVMFSTCAMCLIKHHIVMLRFISQYFHRSLAHENAVFFVGISFEKRCQNGTDY